MLFIGYYYTDRDVCYLYKSPGKMSNWVSNIVYFDEETNRLYSPNIKNLAKNGRNADGAPMSDLYWASFITDAHDSFVLK